MPQKRKKATLDDGCNPELFSGAEPSGFLEMPVVHAPASIEIPKGMTPYSQVNRLPTNREMICFFEHDTTFSDVLINPDAHIKKLLSLPMMTQIDCSVYRDMPFAAQLTNIYRSRLIAAYYQRKGVNVWPLARWGDDRSYTDDILPEPPAFCGIEKNSPIVVSSYGCSRGRENQKHFEAGLDALVDFIRPCLILFYGTPRHLAKHIEHRTETVFYPDWTSRMKGGR